MDCINYLGCTTERYLIFDESSVEKIANELANLTVNIALCGETGRATIMDSLEAELYDMILGYEEDLKIADKDYEKIANAYRKAVIKYVTRILKHIE